MINKIKKWIEEKQSAQHYILNKLLYNSSIDKLVIEGQKSILNIRIYIKYKSITCKAYVPNRINFIIKNKNKFKNNIKEITELGCIILEFNNIDLFSIFLERINEEFSSSTWKVFEYNKELDNYIEIIKGEKI